MKKYKVPVNIAGITELFISDSGSIHLVGNGKEVSIDGFGVACFSQKYQAGKHDYKFIKTISWKEVKAL